MLLISSNGQVAVAEYTDWFFLQAVHATTRCMSDAENSPICCRSAVRILYYKSSRMQTPTNVAQLLPDTRLHHPKDSCPALLSVDSPPWSPQEAAAFAPKRRVPLVLVVAVKEISHVTGSLLAAA
jgi:hypothetical protein